MFAGVLAVASVPRAQETPPAAPAEASPAPPPAAPAGEPAPAAAPSTAKPDSTRPVGPTPGRFEPTEKVRADFDVAFPVDI